jgi:predicted O-linked N-acetylglucosamine transferase (SPINDLY family)
VIPLVREHLDLYNRIDIGLDTFPYNGTTTTCEALWMGVPVITLAGATHASRVGVSLLSSVGLPELIATTPEEYMAIAVGLAHDLEKLQSLRRSLRGMMARSPLTDAQTFTHHLEEVVRRMWTAWCLDSQ